MVRVRNKNISKRLLLALPVLFLMIVPKVVSAQVSSSNYQSNEFFFGTGGDVEVSSPNYKAQGSAGALGVGQFSSTNYQAFSGFLTPNEPFLEFGLDTSVVNLGTLDTTTAKTGNASFHVRAYIDSGYTVKTMSQPPSMTSGASYTLTAMSLGASSPGTEQFGINLVANTSPVSFGNDPSPQPNSTFATGQAAAGYGTANNFKYTVGDTVAQTAGSGWGLTNYTVSYIANISVLTPAGSYTMIHDLVAVATY
ncbi:MAG TPA: hypothetical protein VIK37_02950 [Candidatus Saccharimonadales bacterium]